MYKKFQDKQKSVLPKCFISTRSYFCTFSDIQRSNFVVFESYFRIKFTFLIYPRQRQQLTCLK